MLVAKDFLWLRLIVVTELTSKNNNFQNSSINNHHLFRLFHGPPTIPHYAKNKAVGVMRAGHVFTIEPMINEGTWQDMLWPDDWTAVTVDGKDQPNLNTLYLLLTLAVTFSPNI